MAERETVAKRGLTTRAALPLMAVAMAGGMATMLGRGRRKSRSRMQRADLVRNLNDPKVRAALEAAQRALDDARSQIASRDGRKVQEQISKRTGSALDSTMNTLPPAMRDASERARELAERVRVEGLPLAAELNQRLREDVAPKAKTFAQEAIVEAEDILAEARQRATELSKNARRDYGPGVSTKASALAGLLAAGSSTGFDLLRDKVTDVAGQAAKKGAGKKTKRAQTKVSQSLQSAGNQAKYVATESMMVGVWATLLGVTVYFALLTREQRDRIKGFFGNIISQVKDIVTDFQETGSEFQGSTR